MRKVSLQFVNSVEIMRTGFRARYGKRPYALRFYRDHVVLVLQNSFHHQKALRNEQDAMSVQKIGRDDRVGYPGFVFQAEKQEPLGGSGTLAGDDASARKTHRGRTSS